MDIKLLFLYLLGAHAICDYPLQGDFLARGKNHTNPIPGIPFYQCLMAHALIHAVAVTLITGNLYLGLAEFFMHCLIDYGKCNGNFNFDTDQFLHVMCKIVWASIWLCKN